MKNISAALLFLLMILFANVAFADPPATPAATPAASDTSASNLSDIKAALKPESMSGYSKPQYAAIFGCPGGFFKGTVDCDATVFGYVAGQFNTIALIMGVVVLLYILLGGAINTAASGEVLGKSWSSAWLPIRVVAAFGLIIPTASIAPYSPAQMAPMYAIIIGDNLATAATKNIAAKVADKSLTVTPKTPAVPSLASIAIAGSVFCAANEWNAQTRGGTAFNDNEGRKLLATVEQGVVNNDEEDVVVKKMPYNYKKLAAKEFFELEMGESGKCGTLTIPTVGVYSAKFTSDDVIARKKASYKAVAAVIYADMAAYAEIENTMRINGLDDGIMELMNETGSKIPPEKVAVAEAARLAFLSVANTFPSRVQQALASGYSGKPPTKTLANRVVIHYTDINKLLYKLAVYNSEETSAAVEAFSGMQNNSWDQCFKATKSCKEKLNDDEIEELEEGVGIPSTMLGMKIMQKAVGGNSSGVSGIELGLSDLKEPSGVWNRMAKGIKIAILEVFSDYDVPSTGNPADAMNFTLNPMVLFHNLANAFAHIGVALSLLLAAASVFASPGFINSSIFMAFHAILSPIMYLAFTASISLLFITVVPIVIGLWGYLSIIIMGIQGVAAAPFAVVMLATPEGHGMMTSTFQRFLLHWTHLVLAPMIFVLGAVASLSLMIVGANIAIWTFVVDMEFFGSDSVFVILGSIGIFIYVLYQLVMKLSTFQLTLQSEIMEILGGNFHKPLGQNQAQEALATTEKSNEMAGGIGKGLQASGKKYGEGREAKKNPKPPTTT